MCHLVFFLPVFGLPVFWIFPFNAALPIYLFIVVISMILYWKIYQAMTSRVLTGREGMLSKTGMVIQNINPEGKIKYATEIWNAVAEGKTFNEGEKVVINGFSYGMRVIVAEATVERN
jgi:membrane-bound ClpP family serine protease